MTNSFASLKATTKASAAFSALYEIQVTGLTLFEPIQSLDTVHLATRLKERQRERQRDREIERERKRKRQRDREKEKKTER